MTEPYSVLSATPLAFSDPDTCSLKMSQGTLLSAAPELLQNLPAYGITVDGALYERQKPERLTNVNAYLSGARLKTPTATENVKPRPDRVDGDRFDLADQLGKLLATPRSAMEQTRNNQAWIRPLDQPQNLENQLARLLPTPVVNDMGAGKTPEQWEVLTEKWKQKHGGNGHGNSLNIEVLKLLTGDSTKPLLEDGKP